MKTLNLSSVTCATRAWRTPRRRRAQERGYSLIFAVSVILLLTLSGLMVLDASWADVQLASADRQSLAAMYAAEAGAIWGKEYLVQQVYANGPTAPNPAVITSWTQAAVGQPICTGGKPVACTAYYYMPGAYQAAYPDANSITNYTVAVTCSPYSNCTSVQSYTIRSYGVATAGANSVKRMVEITLAASGS